VGLKHRPRFNDNSPDRWSAGVAKGQQKMGHGCRIDLAPFFVVRPCRRPRSQIDCRRQQRHRISEKQQKSNSGKEKKYAINHVFISVPFLVMALATVPFTWDNPDLARTVLLSILLFSPLLAGVSGATARKAFETIGGPSMHDPPSIGPTAGLGAIAGGVAGAMFIVAQLVAMSPEIGQTVWSKQAGRLVPFAVLIGFVAGLTLDAVFRRLTGVNVITEDMLKMLSERGATKTPGGS
jgi:hypothetical protein